MGVGDSEAQPDPKTIRAVENEGVALHILINSATVLSKTSFGITLLRITTGRLKGAIWTLIILMNLFVLLYILFEFLKCEPRATSWIKGEGCWSWDTYIKVGVFAGGM